ncbi:MAG: UPF0149 family protein [Pseudomonadales bacterium]
MYCDLLELLPGESRFELPAELHGLACGALCAGMILDETRWRELTELAGAQIPAQDVDMVLLALLRSAHALDAEDFAFEPLLPDDEGPLRERLQALAAWCDGFLLSFGIANPDVSLVSEDVAAAIADLQEVVQVDSDVAGSEDEEWQYTEVKEYVKSAALLIREELREAGDA